MRQERLKVIYIAGYGRSGSTLLARMLGQIPYFESVGELKHIWERSFKENQLCGCGRPFFDCSFWAEVVADAYGSFDAIDGAQMRQQQLSVDRVRKLPKLLWTNSNSSNDYWKQERAYTGALRQLYCSISKVSGKDTIIDSSKDVSTPFLLSRMQGVDLYLLHLVRDSRGVAYSWTKRKARPEITKRNEYMQQHTPFRSAYRWLTWNSLIHAGFARKPSSSYIRLRYEDFIQSPIKSLQYIVATTAQSNVDFSFVDRRKVQLSITNHTVAGNPDRFQKGQVQLKFDEEWKVKLPPSARRLVTVITYPLLKKYGYL